MNTAMATWTPDLGQWTDSGCRHQRSYAEQDKSGPIIISLELLADSETISSSSHKVNVLDGTSAGRTNERNTLIGQSSGEALLEIRLRTGLTWELLGELFRVSRRTIHHWVCGKAPSVQHELDIRRTLDAIRQLDEGSQLATRDRLLTSVNGLSLFGLLVESRYNEVMRIAVGAGSVAVKQTNAFSEEEWTKRRPPTPDMLLGAMQDRPVMRTKSARIAKPARRKRRND